MNWLDKAIGYVAPVTAMKRARARRATRIYEGAATGRRTTSWKTQHLSENAELMYSIRPLRDRSRDLIRNTPHAARMVKILTSHIVGTGIIPVPNTGSDKIDNLINQHWADWNAVADASEQIDFYSMQSLSVRAMIESGEVVLRYIDLDMDNDRDTPVPLALHCLESDYIDQFRDGLYGSADIAKMPLRRSRLGVGLGEFDSFRGLWLFKNHPGELNTIWQLPYISDFIPKSELIHMFGVLRPGQVRGVPWMAPILTTARELSDFLDAVNVKAKVEACFTAFITNDDSTAPLLDPAQDSALQTADFANPNAQVTTLEPGLVKELREGQDIKFAQPTSATHVETILMNNLQAMAAGVGCTYDQMSGDLRQANYSSLRAGKLDFWRLIDEVQKRIVIPKLCKPVYTRFISRAILAGELPFRGEISARAINQVFPCSWVVPAKEYIDPKKDADAEKNEVRAGRITPQEYMAARGNNWRKNLEDIKAFFDMAHDMGIVLDIDASKVDQHGKQPTKQSKPGEGPEEEPTTDDVVDDEADDNEDDSDQRVMPFRLR